MSDDIINLGEYLRRKDAEASGDRTTFAVWGGEGERSRFALPLWRAIFLAGGSRGGLVWTGPGTQRPRPFVVLDLVRDPARLEFPQRLVDEGGDSAAPALRDRNGDGLSIYLGDHRGRHWHLVVDGVGDREDALQRRAREDLLFLAGECAGLLFLRDMAAWAPDPEDDGE